MNKYLNKQLQSRQDKLRFDFLPSMIEIIEKPASRLASVIMYTIIALIVTTIIWACIARIDIAVTVNGNVDTENALVTLNSLTDGTISEVKVSDGDYVNKGDIICSFISEVSEATLKEYEYNLEALNIQKEVYEKLYDKYKEDDYTSLDMDTSEYGNNSKICEAIVLENDVFIDSLKDLSPDDIERLKKKQLLAVLQNINNIDVRIESVYTQLQSGRKSLNDMTIVATESGTYTSKDKLYVGKTVQAGDVVGYITNSDNAYKFTAYAADKDITQLNAGDTVKLRITAYAHTSYEYIEGTITRINDVPMNIEGKGTYYLMEIQFHTIPDHIKSGMEGSVDIIVGTRTVMDYFLDPFKKGLEGSLKEK